eukprot:gene17853-23466_t
MSPPVITPDTIYWEGDVCVIGSGWSGMLAAKHCKEHGLKVRILEKSDYPGGVWKYTDTPGGVMASTQTTSSWSFTEISDFPLLPEDGLVTDFPKHDIVQNYLERYAAHNKLPDITSYNSAVVWVTKDSNNKFNIVTSDNKLYVSDKLVVSTGFLGNPRSKGFESLTKNYTGEIRHANTYKHVKDEHYNKNILVIGGGETASDLCNEISYVAKNVYLSIPNGQWFGGRFNQHWEYSSAWPLDNFSSRLRRFFLDGNPQPEKFEAMKDWAEKYDGFHGHGFECWRSQYEVYGQAIINKSNDVLRRAVLGRVFPKGKMDRIEGRTVYFKDGTVAEDVELIYFATGYRMEFPFLEGIGRKNQCVSTLYKLCLDTRDENLAFVGFSRPIRGSFPSISESASRLVAHLWSKEIPMLPDYERERIRRLDKLTRDLFFTAFDKYGYTKKCPDTGGIAKANARAAGLTDLFTYADECAELCGCMPNYNRLFFECGFKVWLIAMLAPHHQGQYLLNDRNRRDYVIERYRYFLTRFPIYAPIIFSIFMGAYHYIKAFIRNRIFWTIGFLLVKRPHEGAVHIYEYKADIAKQRRALSRYGALKGEWPPAEEVDGSCTTSCSSSSSSCSTDNTSKEASCCTIDSNGVRTCS